MHRISHHVTQLAVPFPGNPCGHGDRGDTPRLRHHDARHTVTRGVQPVVQQKLRQLSRFASNNATHHEQCQTKTIIMYMQTKKEGKKERKT